MFDDPRAAAPTPEELSAMASCLGVSIRAARACCARLRALAAALVAANDGPELAPELRWKGALRLGVRLLTVEGQGAVADVASRLLARLDGDARSLSDTALRAMVTQCLTERRVLSLEYWSVEGNTWEPRQVEPLALSNVDGHWTLLAFCRTRMDLRSFRFDRVRSASPTDLPFEARRGLSLERFLLRSKGSQRPRLAG